MNTSLDEARSVPLPVGWVMFSAFKELVGPLPLGRKELFGVIVLSVHFILMFQEKEIIPKMSFPLFFT